MKSSNCYSFTATIEIIGINPYVFVPDAILQQIFQDAGRDKSPIPVKGQVNDRAYRQTLVRYQGEWRLYINMMMLDRSPDRVGELISVSIGYDPEDRSIQPHPQLLKAIEENAEAKDTFENLNPSLQKEIIRYVGALKSQASVELNIQKAINFLLGKGRFVGRELKK
jgi:hypothetical protein